MSREIITSLSIKPLKESVSLRTYSSNVYPKTAEPFEKSFDGSKEFNDWVEGFLEGNLNGEINIVASANQYKWSYRLSEITQRIFTSPDFVEFRNHPQNDSQRADFKVDAFALWDFMKTSAFRKMLPGLTHDFIYGVTNEPQHANRKNWIAYYVDASTVKAVTKRTARYYYYTVLADRMVPFSFYQATYIADSIKTENVKVALKPELKVQMA